MRHAAAPPPRRRRRGRAASAASGGGQRRYRASQLPYAILLTGAAAGVLTMVAEQDVRGGTLVIAGVLLIAAVTRLVLPEQRAGMLASRRRLADVATFAVLGFGLLAAGLALPGPA
jgi:hypothetical protein